MIRLANRLTEPLMFSRKAHLVLLIAQAAGLTIISFGVWFVPDWTVWFALVGFWSPFFLHTLVGVRERRELRRSRANVVVTDTTNLMVLAPGQGASFGYTVTDETGGAERMMFRLDIVDERTVLVTVPKLPTVVHGNQPEENEARLTERRARRKLPWLPAPTPHPGAAGA